MSAVHQFDLAEAQATTQLAASHRDSLAALLEFRVTDAASAQFASDAAHQLRGSMKAFAAERDKAIGPLEGVVKTVRGWFAPHLKLGDEILAHLRDQLGAFQTRMEAEQRAALLQAAERSSPEEVKAAVAIVSPAPAGVQHRTTWSYEIVDRALIPAEYWVLDTKRLEAEARARKGELSIPGVKPVANRTAVLR